MLVKGGHCGPEGQAGTESGAAVGLAGREETVLPHHEPPDKPWDRHTTHSLRSGPLAQPLPSPVLETTGTPRLLEILKHSGYSVAPSVMLIAAPSPHAPDGTASDTPFSGSSSVEMGDCHRQRACSGRGVLRLLHSSLSENTGWFLRAGVRITGRSAV